MTIREGPAPWSVLPPPDPDDTVLIFGEARDSIRLRMVRAFLLKQAARRSDSYREKRLRRAAERAGTTVQQLVASEKPAARSPHTTRAWPVGTRRGTAAVKRPAAVTSDGDDDVASPAVRFLPLDLDNSVRLVPPPCAHRLLPDEAEACRHAFLDVLDASERVKLEPCVTSPRQVVWAMQTLGAFFDDADHVTRLLRRVGVTPQPLEGPDDDALADPQTPRSNEAGTVRDDEEQHGHNTGRGTNKEGIRVSAAQFLQLYAAWWEDRQLHADRVGSVVDDEASLTNAYAQMLGVDPSSNDMHRRVVKRALRWEALQRTLSALGVPASVEALVGSDDGDASDSSDDDETTARRKAQRARAAEDPTSIGAWAEATAKMADQSEPPPMQLPRFVPAETPVLGALRGYDHYDGPQGRGYYLADEDDDDDDDANSQRAKAAARKIIRRAGSGPDGAAPGPVSFGVAADVARVIVKRRDVKQMAEADAQAAVAAATTPLRTAMQARFRAFFRAKQALVQRMRREMEACAAGLDATADRFNAPHVSSGLASTWYDDLARAQIATAVEAAEGDPTFDATAVAATPARRRAVQLWRDIRSIVTHTAAAAHDKLLKRTTSGVGRRAFNPAALLARELAQAPPYLTVEEASASFKSKAGASSVMAGASMVMEGSALGPTKSFASLVASLALQKTDHQMFFLSRYDRQQIQREQRALDALVMTVMHFVAYQRAVRDLSPYQLVFDEATNPMRRRELLAEIADDEQWQLWRQRFEEVMEAERLEREGGGAADGSSMAVEDKLRELDAFLAQCKRDRARRGVADGGSVHTNGSDSDGHDGASTSEGGDPTAGDASPASQNGLETTSSGDAQRTRRRRLTTAALAEHRKRLETGAGSDDGSSSVGAEGNEPAAPSVGEDATSAAAPAAAGPGEDREQRSRRHRLELEAFVGLFDTYRHGRSDRRRGATGLDASALERSDASLPFGSMSGSPRARPCYAHNAATKRELLSEGLLTNLPVSPPPKTAGERQPHGRPSLSAAWFGSAPTDGSFSGVPPTPRSPRRSASTVGRSPQKRANSICVNTPRRRPSQRRRSQSEAYINPLQQRLKQLPIDAFRRSDAARSMESALGKVRLQKTWDTMKHEDPPPAPTPLRRSASCVVAPARPPPAQGASSADTSAASVALASPSVVLARGAASSSSASLLMDASAQSVASTQRAPHQRRVTRASQQQPQPPAPSVRHPQRPQSRATRCSSSQSGVASSLSSSVVAGSIKQSAQTPVPPPSAARFMEAYPGMYEAQARVRARLDGGTAETAKQ